MNRIGHTFGPILGVGFYPSPGVRHPASQRLIAVFLAIAFLGSGCGPGGGGGSSTVDNFPKAKITLTIWRPANDADGFADTISEYGQQHGNVSFVFKIINPDTYEKDLIEALAAGKGPDIVSLPNDRIHAYQDKLVAMPDTFFGGTSAVNKLTSLYPEAVVTDTVSDGKIYGIPLVLNTLMLFWNRSIFQNEFNRRIKNQEPTNELLFRAPVDWQEMIQLTQLLTKRNGDNFDLSAISLGVSNNISHNSDIIAALMLQQGVKMVTADHKNAAFHLPDPADPTYYPGAAVLEYLHGYTDPASNHYTWNAAQPDSVQAFIDGRLAMMLNYQSVIPYLNQRKPDLNFALAPLPQIANTKTIVDFAGEYRVEAVTKDSKNAPVAWDFLSTMTKIGLPLYLEKTGSPSAVKVFPPTTTVSERISRSDAALMQVSTAKSWYKGTSPDQADQTLNESLDRVSRQGQAAKDSLIEAATAFTQLLNTQVTAP